MRRFIELKHVGPKQHVQTLLEELSDRLEDKLGHFSGDTVSLHVVFDESGSHKLYRTSLTCHIPGHTMAAHEEQRDPGASIRRAFAELERQLEKQKATVQRERLRRRSQRTQRVAPRRRPALEGLVVLALSLIAGAPRPGYAEEAAPSQPSPRAVEAMQLLESKEPYDRQKGFLRLEALREPATLPAIERYLTSKDPEMRAYSLRAVAAIQGTASVPLLLNTLKTEKHPKVRRAALLGMEPFAQAVPEVIPLLIESLRDRKPVIRMTAVDIVSRIDDPRAREALLLRNKREKDRDVRRVLKLAMERFGS
jgi:ribosome-associated translation inhibitor RaiA